MGCDSEYELFVAFARVGQVQSCVLLRTGCAAKIRCVNEYSCNRVSLLGRPLTTGVSTWVAHASANGPT